MKALYDQAMKDKIPSSEQHTYVFNELEKHPLSLYGRKSNYNHAFHKSSHVPWSGGFIYLGEASVRSTPDGFELISSDKVRDKSRGREILALIRVACDTDNPVDQMEKKTIEILEDTVSAGRKIRWHAYGELRLNESQTAYELVVEEPSHIYVRTA